jgi:hypothetical protein
MSRSLLLRVGEDETEGALDLFGVAVAEGGELGGERELVEEDAGGVVVGVAGEEFVEGVEGFGLQAVGEEPGGVAELGACVGGVRLGAREGLGEGVSFAEEVALEGVAGDLGRGGEGVPGVVAPDLPVVCFVAGAAAVDGTFGGEEDTAAVGLGCGRGLGARLGCRGGLLGEREAEREREEEG